MRSFFVDAGIGALAYAAVYFLEIPLAVSRSIVPWLIAPAAFLVAGFLLGSGKGSLWAKSARINLGNWCLMVYMLTSYDRFPSVAEWREALPWILNTFVSAGCGIAARRLSRRVLIGDGRAERPERSPQ
jgi:hypothetical protein